MSEPQPFSRDPDVRGFLHLPDRPSGDVLVISHGAGSDANAPLLIHVASVFAEAGFAVLRLNLPFRQARPKGPPIRGSARRDRDGLLHAVEEARGIRSAGGRIFLGGHSYGGRQSSIVASEHTGLVEGLLLLSYPLHPPARPDQVRTAHFAALCTPTLFVHGSRDPFGSLEEMTLALTLIAAPTRLIPVEGAGHELAYGRSSKIAKPDLPAVVLAAFEEFFPVLPSSP